MQKPFQAALMALILAGTATGAFAATTALDSVGTAYSATDNVAMLGLAGGGTASLHAHGVWGQVTPGAKATLEAVTDSQNSGYLLYTLHGKASCKITVATETLGYNSASLWAACYTIAEAGSGRSTLGTPVEEAPYATPIYRLPSGNSAQDYIIHIAGGDTWTGTAAGNGAAITYGLFSDPGVSQVLVIFTIMEE